MLQGILSIQNHQSARVTGIPVVLCFEATASVSAGWTTDINHSQTFCQPERMQSLSNVLIHLALSRMILWEGCWRAREECCDAGGSVPPSLWDYTLFNATPSGCPSPPRPLNKEGCRYFRPQAPDCKILYLKYIFN